MPHERVVLSHLGGALVDGLYSSRIAYQARVEAVVMSRSTQRERPPISTAGRTWNAKKPASVFSWALAGDWLATLLRIARGRQPLLFHRIEGGMLDSGMDSSVIKAVAFVHLRVNSAYSPRAA
jgi:hypothetical protein